MQYSTFHRNDVIQEKREESIKKRQVELDEIYERFIGSEIEGLLENDETYQYQSTPLKTAEAIKEDHKHKIREELEQKELRRHITQAYDLIMQRLPQMISPTEFDQLKEEFTKSADYFYEISQKPPEFIDQVGSLQDCYGISDVSMMLMYSLAYTCLKNQEFSNAESILYFLTLLNPAISIFWIGLGISLQNQGKEESKIMFETAQILDPMNPNAFILGAESDIQFKNKEQAEEQLKIAEEIINNSISIENKKDLINKINYLRKI